MCNGGREKGLVNGHRVEGGVCRGGTLGALLHKIVKPGPADGGGAAPR